MRNKGLFLFLIKLALTDAETPGEARLLDES